MSKKTDAEKRLQSARNQLQAGILKSEKKEHSIATHKDHALMLELEDMVKEFNELTRHIKEKGYPLTVELQGQSEFVERVEVRVNWEEQDSYFGRLSRKKKKQEGTA